MGCGPFSHPGLDWDKNSALLFTHQPFSCFLKYILCMWIMSLFLKHWKLEAVSFKCEWTRITEDWGKTWSILNKSIKVAKLKYVKTSFIEMSPIFILCNEKWFSVCSVMQLLEDYRSCISWILASLYSRQQVQDFAMANLKSGWLITETKTKAKQISL